ATDRRDHLPCAEHLQADRTLAPPVDARRGLPPVERAITTRDAQAGPDVLARDRAIAIHGPVDRSAALARACHQRTRRLIPIRTLQVRRRGRQTARVRLLRL